MNGTVRLQTYSRGELTIGADYLTERDPVSIADARARLSKRAEHIKALERMLTGVPVGPLAKRQRAALGLQLQQMAVLNKRDRAYLRTHLERVEAARHGIWDRTDPAQLLARCNQMLVEYRRLLTETGREVPADLDALKHACQDFGLVGG